MFLKNFLLSFVALFFLISCNQESKDNTSLSSETSNSSKINHSFHPTNQETTANESQENTPEADQTTSTPDTKTETATANINEKPQDSNIETQSTPDTETETATANINEKPQDSNIETQSTSPFLINYNKQSVGKIDMNITKESANQILTLQSEKTLGNDYMSIYKEGLNIVWNKEEQAQQIFAHKGVIITDNNKVIKLPLGSQIPVNMSYKTFTGMYNTFENVRIDCFQEEKCFVIPTQGNPNYFVLYLPKIQILFTTTTNNNVQLLEVRFDRDNKDYNDIILDISQESNPPTQTQLAETPQDTSENQDEEQDETPQDTSEN